MTSETVIGFTWSNGKTSGGRAIIDYRVSYDQGMNQFIVLDSKVTLRSYTTSVPILAGQTYKFKVEARNEVGYSSASQEISILAATTPVVPTAPVTTINGENVVITWLAPYNGGTSITGYTINI